MLFLRISIGLEFYVGWMNEIERFEINQFLCETQNFRRYFVKNLFQFVEFEAGA